MTRKKNNRRRERSLEERQHLRTYMNELLDHETKRKLEALRDELARTNGGKK